MWSSRGRGRVSTWVCRVCSPAKSAGGDGSGEIMSWIVTDGSQITRLPAAVIRRHRSSVSTPLSDKVSSNPPSSFSRSVRKSRKAEELASTLVTKRTSGAVERCPAKRGRMMPSGSMLAPASRRRPSGRRMAPQTAPTDGSEVRRLRARSRATGASSAASCSRRIAEADAQAIAALRRRQPQARNASPGHR
jgi:hypothetical protein